MEIWAHHSSLISFRVTRHECTSCYVSVFVEMLWSWVYYTLVVTLHITVHIIRIYCLKVGVIVSVFLCRLSTAIQTWEWRLQMSSNALQRPTDIWQCHRVFLWQRLCIERRLQIFDLQEWQVESRTGGYL